MSSVPVHSSYPCRQASGMESRHDIGLTYTCLRHMSYIMLFGHVRAPTIQPKKMVVWMQNLAFKSQVITHQPILFFLNSLSPRSSHTSQNSTFFFQQFKSQVITHTSQNSIFFFFQQFTSQNSTFIFQQFKSQVITHTSQNSIFFFFQQFTSQDSTFVFSSLSPRSSHTPAKIQFFLFSAVYQPRFYLFFSAV